MANTNTLFKQFDEKIKLTEPKKEELRTSRDAIREDVERWLLDNEKGNSRFCLQGSFAMNTTVNPINSDEFDIDYGVYLLKFEETEKSAWPIPDTVHNWILSAVSNRTSKTPINKNACVRVSYGHGYHVDIPIYIEQDGVTYLANRSEGWLPSDASGFVKWLNDKKDADGQLVRIIRYLKRWKDYRDVPLKGIEITIMTANYFSPANTRDDDAIRYTVEAILASLRTSFTCIKPVIPYEDMFVDVSSSKKESILNELDVLLDNLQKASDASDEGTAADYLRTVFGDSFPKGESSQNKAASYIATSTPAVLEHDGRSA